MKTRVDDEERKQSQVPSQAHSAKRGSSAAVAENSGLRCQGGSCGTNWLAPCGSTARRGRRGVELQRVEERRRLREVPVQGARVRPTTTGR